MPCSWEDELLGAGEGGGLKIPLKCGDLLRVPWSQAESPDGLDWHPAHSAQAVGALISVCRMGMKNHLIYPTGIDHAV